MLVSQQPLSPLCLQAMQAVDVPVYDFASHQRSQRETRRVEPADVIVIEGILVLHIPDVCQRLNMKVYVDTDDDVRLARRWVAPSGLQALLYVLTLWTVTACSGSHLCLCSLQDTARCGCAWPRHRGRH